MTEDEIIKRGIKVRKCFEAISKAINNLCHSEAVVIIEKEIQKLIDTAGDK